MIARHTTVTEPAPPRAADRPEVTAPLTSLGDWRLAVETAGPMGGLLGWTPARAVVQWSGTKG